MSASSPMTIGMVGVGGFGSYRLDRIRETGLFKLGALCDRNADVLAAACKQENCKGVADFDDLLKQPGLEGIVISTGIDTHVEFAVRALAAGLHVFVEKPLCGSPQEINRIVEAQRFSGRVVALGHHDNHTDRVCLLVKQYLAEGRLGTLACYEENSSHGGGLIIRPGDWRGLRERNPGGMLMQCGVHAFHRLTHLFGPIASLSAIMRYDANPNTQTADVANVLVRHESGIVGTLNCYHVTAYCHELRLFGSNGNLYIDTHLKRAWFQERRSGAAEERVEVALPPADPLETTSNLVNWYKAIRHGTPPSPSLDDGIRAVLPVFAAERSDCEQRLVAMSEVA